MNYSFHKPMVRNAFLSFLIGSIFVITPIRLRAQTNAILYWNENTLLTTQEKSTLRCEATINALEMILEGPYQVFSADNKLVEEGAYNSGVKSGVVVTYKDGKLRSRIEYIDGEFNIRDLMDDDGTPMVKDGTGKFSIPYTYYENYFSKGENMNGQLIGEFKDGKRTGRWVYETHSARKITYVEKYGKGGALISRVGETPGSGKTAEISEMKFRIAPEKNDPADLEFDAGDFRTLDSYFDKYPIKNLENVNRTIVYAGGQKKLLNIIQRNLKYPVEDRRNVTQGQVMVSIVVSEQGVVTQQQILKNLSPTADRESLRITTLLHPKLFPALSNGKPYESTVVIPINFKLN